MSDKPKLILVLWTRRTPKRSRTSFGGSFFYAYGIITFAYPYLSTISRLRQRSSLPFQSHASSSWAVENEIPVTPMRAASPPRQMERENEMIVISHRLFLMGMRISPFTGCCLSFLLYWMRHTATPRTRIVTRRRCLMDFIITFCGSVAASMIAHYLCKWLDRKT